jgi:tripartite-type tricarboxylate transporter receptor subunit TctC
MTHTSRRTLLRATLASAAIGGLPAAGRAQAWPDRPIRLLVGFAPGGSSDVVARLLAQRIAAPLGQPVVVENRVGAGGLLAAEAVSRGPADGYTWVLLPSGHATQAAILRRMPMDPVEGFAWIGTLTTYPMVIGVAPESPMRTLRDLVDRARATPGKLSFTSVGVGTAHHLLGEWINAELGIELTHVPYKGSPLALTDLLGGQIDMMIDTATFVVPQSRQGKLQPLAVTTRGPSEDLPGVPTLNSFIAGMEYDSWIGITGPKGMPAELVQQLNQDLREIVNLPDIRQRFIDMGAAPKVGTPDEFRQLAEKDLAQWRKVIDNRNIPRL